MTSVNSYGHAIAAQVSRVRREVGELSLMAFAKTYLKHHFTESPSSMHLELVQELEAMTFERRGARLAVAAPRGHAKSTVATLAYVLWCLVYRREPLIYVVSDGLEQAVEHLTNIRTELEKNELLRTDFPDVCEPATSTTRPRRRWRLRELVTVSGAKVIAFGSGSKLRGRKHGADRPSLIILDDLENEEQADSPDRREKLLDWLNKAVLNAGTNRTNVVVVGTVLNYDAVLANLLKSPAWSSRKYQAVTSWAIREDLWERWTNIFNHLAEYEGRTGREAARLFFEANREQMLEGAGALWPEHESYYELMTLRISLGQFAFDSEKMNEPANPRDAVFRPGDIRCWDDSYATEEELLHAIGPRHLVVGALDPSLGKAGRNRDDSAIITVVIEGDTMLKYVLDADIARRQPDEIIEAVIAYHRRRQYDVFYVEATQFQEFLAEEIIKRSRALGLSIPVEFVKPTKDKFGRIQSLQPKVHSGEIRFSRRHRVLLEQLTQFPKGAHDDGPDALEMAVTGWVRSADDSEPMFREVEV